MSKIKFELYGDEAELVGMTSDSSYALTLDFGCDTEGYVTFGGAVARVDGGVCEIDTRRVGNGEHEPTLILDELIIRLPKLIKYGATVAPSAPSDEYLRAASRRTRLLGERISSLEGVIEEIKNKIYGTTVL